MVGPHSMGIQDVRREALSRILMNSLGLPYKYRGRDPAAGLDPAGFVWYVFGQLNQTVPDDEDEQQVFGTRFPAHQFREGDFLKARHGLATGDLLFFKGKSRRTGSIVTRPMIFLGDDQAVFPSASENRVVRQNIRPIIRSLAFVQRVLRP